MLAHEHGQQAIRPVNQSERHFGMMVRLASASRNILNAKPQKAGRLWAAARAAIVLSRRGSKSETQS